MKIWISFNIERDYINEIIRLIWHVGVKGYFFSFFFKDTSRGRGRSRGRDFAGIDVVLIFNDDDGADVNFAEIDVALIRNDDNDDDDVVGITDVFSWKETFKDEI